MYADDIQLYKSFKRQDCLWSTDELNFHLNSILNLSIQLNLNANSSKRQVILFGNSNTLRRMLEVKVTGLVLPIVDSLRDLRLAYFAIVFDSDVYCNEEYRKARTSCLRYLFGITKL